MAEIGWIDFSTKDRNRVGSILDLLRPEGQIDELGIGVIRDALANQMFPGISTIQTRAKYFFIIPYILYDYLKLPLSRRKKIPPAKYLEQKEYEVMWYLAEKYKDGDGVIGISKKKPEKIVRRPSEIYWNGLNIFGFLDSKGLSAKSFLNNGNKINLSQTDLSIENGESKDDVDASFENFFNIKVEYQANWNDNLTLNLNDTEATFFKDALLDKNGSVLSLLAGNPKYWELFRKSNTFIDFAKQIIHKEISEDLKQIITLSHDFAILIEGAHIAYNQEIQKYFFNYDSFEKEWDEWYSSVKKTMINYSEFKPDDLFLYATTAKPFTVSFVNEWWELLKKDNLNKDRKSKIIRTQEYYTKKNKARIKYNRRYDVKENKRLGLSILQYRFGNVKLIIEDVLSGLKTL